MSDSAHNPDDYCYRHPDRLSFVLCERCGRTICLECQNHVDGRVLCPDDAQARVTQISEAREAHAQRQKRTATRNRLRVTVPPALQGHPLVTYSILAIVLVLFLVDIIARGVIMPHLWVLTPDIANALGVGDVLHQPWSLVTSMITTSNPIGLLLGGYSVFVIGRWIEPQLGGRNFAIVYIAGGLGASIFAFLLDGLVTSWFGALMGISLAAVMLARRMRASATFLYVSVAISIVLSFFLGGWQATVGGALAGVGAGFYFFFDDDKRRQNIARGGLIAVGAALLVLGFVRAIAIT